MNRRAFTYLLGIFDLLLVLYVLVQLIHTFPPK